MLPVARNLKACYGLVHAFAPVWVANSQAQWQPWDKVRRRFELSPKVYCLRLKVYNMKDVSISNTPGMLVVNMWVPGTTICAPLGFLWIDQSEEGLTNKDSTCI
jgi:hypothetical protein